MRNTIYIRFRDICLKQEKFPNGVILYGVNSVSVILDLPEGAEQYKRFIRSLTNNFSISDYNREKGIFSCSIMWVHDLLYLFRLLNTSEFDICVVFDKYYDDVYVYISDTAFLIANHGVDQVIVDTYMRYVEILADTIGIPCEYKVALGSPLPFLVTDRVCMDLDIEKYCKRGC